MPVTTRQKRLAAGLCMTCGKPPVVGKVRCRECLDEENAKQKAYRTKKIGEGFCVNCGTQPIVINNRCIACQAKYNAEHAEKNRQYAKTCRTERTEAGLCESCGKVPPAPGRTKCATCSRRWNDARNKRRADLKANGICTEDACGLPVAPGRTRCEKHFKENRARCDAVRLRRMNSGLCSRCGKEPFVTGIQSCEKCCLKYLAHSLWKDKARWQDLLDLFDSQRGRCRYTGWALTIGLNASIDHIVPSSKGGTDDLDNLQWVDLAINKMKLDHDEADFLAIIARLTERRAIPPASIDLTCNMDLTCEKPMVWRHT